MKKYPNFVEAGKADREFYCKLTGEQRLQILIDLVAARNGDGRIDRSVFRIRKLMDPVNG